MMPEPVRPPTVTMQEFPNHPVAVGESWDGSIQTAAGRGQIDVNAHFTLESVNTVDGHKIAHIAVVEDGGTTGRGAVKIHATGWMEWDVDRGLPLRSHMEGSQDVSGMSSTFTSELTPLTD